MGRQMFAEVPRPWGLAGAMTIVVWLFLVVAFVTDAVPSSSSEDWLYNVEARRSAWGQQLSAREVPALRAEHDGLVAAAAARGARLTAATIASVGHMGAVIRIGAAADPTTALLTDFDAARP